MLSTSELLSRGIEPLARRRPLLTDPRAVLADALLAVGVASRTSGNLEGRLSAICSAMVEILGCDRSSVFLVDGDEIVPTANHGNPPDIAEAFPTVRFSVRHPMFSAALANAEPIHVRDAAASPEMLSTDLVEQARLSSVIAARIVPDDGPPGVITAEFNESKREFGQFDGVVVQGLANVATLVIDEHRARTRESELLAALRHQSLHDQLTGLPNRRALDEWVVAMRDELDDDQEVAVLVADLDRFKAANDSFGHDAGDTLLREVAARFAAAVVRPNAFVGRYGGDEFIVALPVADTGDAEAVATGIADALSEAVDLGGGRAIVMSASVGLAVSTIADCGAGDLFADADTAMYLAKQQRRGQTMFADPARRSIIAQRLDVELGLPSAIERHEIVPWFQPIVELSTQRCVAVEALARWEHPDRGVIPPAEFLPSVADMGLLRDLTDCIVEQTAAILSEPAMADVSAYINLSVEDIDDCLPRRLLDRFDDPTRLAIELTERDAMQQATDVVGVLSQLRECGIRVALDDFGTGFSSMSLLGQLPLDVVKIDRSLIAGAHDERSSKVLSAIVRLGSALDLTVLAEGVERESEMQFLNGTSVELLQGYAVARPMPLADMVRWLDDRTTTSV